MQRRWQILIVTSVAVFMSFLDVTIVNVAFPELEREFSESSRAELSWILNAYNIVFAALLVPAGRLADVLGRKRMFISGICAFLVASVLCGLAGSVEVLVGARILQAAGAAILVPTSLALLLPEFPAAQRATATAIWTATGAVAAAVGPSLGGVLVDGGGWRWAFFVNVPIGLAALVPAFRLLREERDPSRAGLPDVLGSVLLASGVGLIALGIVQGPDWNWDARVVASELAGLLLVALVVVRSRTHAAPVFELALFRIRAFAVANVGMFTFSSAFYALLLANVLFTTQVWGWSILQAGVAISPAPLMAALSAPVGGLLADRFGQRVVAVPGGLLFAAGCLYFATAMDATPDYLTEMLPGQLLTGSGVGLSFAAWGSAAVAELPATRFATGSAILGCVRQVGAVLGIAILVAVLEAGSPAAPVDAFADAWTFMATAGIVTAAVALGLGRVRAVSDAVAPAAAKA